jgi:hypothetical protein
MEKPLNLTLLLKTIRELLAEITVRLHGAADKSEPNRPVELVRTRRCEAPIMNGRFQFAFRGGSMGSPSRRKS